MWKYVNSKYICVESLFISPILDINWRLEFVVKDRQHHQCGCFCFNYLCCSSIVFHGELCPQRAWGMRIHALVESLAKKFIHRQKNRRCSNPLLTFLNTKQRCFEFWTECCIHYGILCLYHLIFQPFPPTMTTNLVSLCKKLTSCLVEQNMLLIF